ncbi:MAG: sulfurtransferase [Methyloprofundus sp.]|nr:sulfurtransferase [Methyloprofundus sp.]
MTYTTLISATELANNLHQPNWVIFDARFNLAQTDAGASSYRQGHIPGARYVHLDNDLSSAIASFTGRHPLPDLQQLVKKLGAWGVSNNSQIVIYDDASGAIAGRFWWLLRCLGHEKVVVLDGGLADWQDSAYQTTTHLPKITQSVYRPYFDTNTLLNALQVENGLAQGTIKLVDARTVERFQGRNEPIDPVAGHIPKAINRPFQLNLNAQGLFLAADELREQFNTLLQNTPGSQVVHMCGSGVTACHNLLAMEIAGLTGSKLYAGSWSEWIRNKNHALSMQNNK